MEQLVKIVEITFESLLQIWPFLIITIPTSVIVNVSGASKYISKSLNKNVLLSIFLATVVGAFSPFCSCGVIPIITSLLIGGVPLAPVMSFWIASPSMDPEIFFLSVATIGWKLSVWRLVSTFIISLSAGFISHFAIKRGYLGKELLRDGKQSRPTKTLNSLLQESIYIIKKAIQKGTSQKVDAQLITVETSSIRGKVNCCVSTREEDVVINDSTPNNVICKCDEQKPVVNELLYKRLFNETWKASFMVVKFMSIAFLISAVLKLYLPQDAIASLMGSNNPFAVVIATLVGTLFYSSNLTALPLVSGLLSLGMNQASALAFLIAGPTTAIPAMVAVWGIANRRVFALYISFSIVGAIVFGFLYLIII
ncbi:MAG: hypothetical protein CVT98_04725 [Bacteroidetes bacterium HGW-Bacteroidetes-15]|nr:MAG: hypothetical protein CVT98_04725 [Bacteroidetes bacterium HGW-Bacteroidetes-15]